MILARGELRYVLELQAQAHRIEERAKLEAGWNA